MRTKEELHELVTTRLPGYLFVVVSNREPYIHSFVGKEISLLASCPME